MEWIRPLKQGAPPGPDIESVKRATFRLLGADHAWSEYVTQKVATRRTWTYFFNRHWRKAEKQLGRPVDGRMDRADWDALRRAKAKKGGPAFDAKAHALWEAAEKKYLGENAMRLKIVQAAKRLYDRNDEIEYSQSRPWKYRPAPLVPSSIDCSGYVSHAYREAGVHDDPNGYEPDWPGWGFTGTLWATGKSISVAQLKPGDLLFYGTPWQTGSSAHVTLYRGGGRAYSMGSDSGPSDVAWNYRPVVGCRTYPVT
jgi:cell wall-associated NlpC family hydrolase